MLKISGLYIYPIKSLGGVSLKSAQVTSRGLEHDRRWMLVDEHNRFLSQREIPEMALLQVEINKDCLVVTHHKQPEKQVYVPFLFDAKKQAVCTIWDDECVCELIDSKIDDWFTAVLKQKCSLVYMPFTSKRQVDQRYAAPENITSFSDGYPTLLIGQASLDDLNNRLDEAVPMDRFRPNIVFTGGEAFQEDQLQHFSINDVDFFGVKPCARCSVITIDQENGIAGKEPLKTLSGYRKKNNKIYFGQNLIHKDEGQISLDDMLIIKQLKPEKFI